MCPFRRIIYLLLFYPPNEILKIFLRSTITFPMWLINLFITIKSYNIYLLKVHSTLFFWIFLDQFSSIARIFIVKKAFYHTSLQILLCTMACTYKYNDVVLFKSYQTSVLIYANDKRSQTAFEMLLISVR